MQNNDLKVDIENIKKLGVLSLGIGGVLAIMVSFDLYIAGLWGLVLTLAWAFSGGFYSQTLLKSGVTSEMLNLALNGAILAAITEIAYDVLSGLILSIRFLTLSSFFSLSLFLQAAVVGAATAVVWNVYQTNKKR